MRMVVRKLLFCNLKQIGFLLWGLVLSVLGSVVFSGIRNSIQFVYTSTHSYSSSVEDILLILLVIFYVTSAYFLMYIAKNYFEINAQAYSVLTVLGCPISAMTFISLSEISIILVISFGIGIACGLSILCFVWKYIGIAGFQMPFAAIVSWQSVVIMFVICIATIGFVAAQNLFRMKQEDFTTLAARSKKKDDISEYAQLYLVAGILMIGLSIYFATRTLVLYQLLAIILFLLGAAFLFNRGMVALYAGIRNNEKH